MLHPINDSFSPPYTGSVIVTRGSEVLSERYFHKGMEVTREEYLSRHQTEFNSTVEPPRIG
jgi:hypothetical protein